MFVQNNTVQAIKIYFHEQLKEIFSEREIKQIQKELITERLDLKSGAYLLCDSQRLSESDLLYFRSCVKRLLKHEPLQYVVGKTLFCDVEINCDARALIPRPETEELVDWVLKSTANKSIQSIIDVCTGSACIALALKNRLLQTTVYALDSEQAALDLAVENAQKLNLAIQTIRFDALQTKENWNFKTKSIDVIVSNPPYIPMHDKETMAKNVLDFEPHVALFVTNDQPLIFYESIGKVAKRILNPQGFLFLELHENLADNVERVMRNIGFQNIEIKEDLQGKKRMMRAGL